MAPKRAPTLRSQWAGQQLRELREDAGLTLRDVGDYIQRDASTVSRMEAGIFPARVPDVLAYVQLCGIDSARRRDDLVKLAQDAWHTGWWAGYVDDVASSLVDRIWLEERATQIHTFETVMVPGLLQTEEYAAAVIRAAAPKATVEQMNRWLEVRLNRQHILHHEHEPVSLFAVLDEAVLHRTVGGSDAMRAQLAHLIAAAGWPNTELRVLPARAGAHASPGGAFEVFTMTEPFPHVGYVQTPAGDLCVEAEGLQDLRETYNGLQDAALDPGASASMISAAAAAME